MSDDTYIRGESGNVYRSTPEQAAARADIGQLNQISEAEAVKSYQQQVDEQLAEAILPGPVKALAGAAQGASLGLGIPTMFKIQEALGIGSPETLEGARHLLRGSRETLPYRAGEIAGLVGTTVATGGLGLEGALASRVLPGASGVLGAMARGAVATGLRGGAEGAIIGLGKAVEDSAIDNRPFTAEAIAARMTDGALLGGGLGVFFGAAGGLAKAALPGAIDTVSSAMRRLGSDTAVMSKTLGAASSDISRIASEFEGGVPGFLRNASEMVEKEGLKLSSSANKIAELAAKNEAMFTKARTAAASELDSAASGVAPSYNRFAEKVRDEIVTPIADLPGGVKASSAIEKWLVDNTPKGNVTFTNWVKGSGIIEDSLQSLEPKIRLQVRNLYHEELGNAARLAEESSPSLKGVAGRLQSAEAGFQTAKELRSLMEGKASRAGSELITGEDARSAIAGMVFGHPLSGLAFAGGKVVQRAAGEYASPVLAETMWRMNTGAKASLASSQMKDRIGEAVDGFFKHRVQPATYQGTKLSRKAYDAEVQRVYSVINADPNQRLNSLIATTGNRDLAGAMNAVATRASTYLSKSIPPAKGQSGQDFSSLRAKPIPEKLDYDEHMFLRKLGVVKNPMSALDDMQQGKLSRESVDALREVWPETYAEVVNAVKMQVVSMKSKGKSLGAGKLTQLSILLGTPVDTMLEPRFVTGVQNSFQQSEQGPGRPPSPPSATDTANSYSTPSEKTEA